MKGKAAFLINLLFFFSISTAAELIKADTVTIAADLWYPYNGKPDSDKPGYCIEIAELIFNSAGHEIDYKIVPWTRAVKETREGKYNAVVGAFVNEVPDFIFPDEEAGLSEISFFTLKENSWSFSSLDSLKKVKTGAIKTYSYGRELDTYFRENPLIVQYMHGEDPMTRNIKKLLAGRIDVIVADPNVFYYKSVNMNSYDRIRYAGSTVNREKIYIAFSPADSKSEEYAELFSEGMKEIRKNGKLEIILNKYRLRYWK